VWAQAVAYGVPDELFWRSTPREAGRLLVEIADRMERDKKEALYRAAFVAAAIYNVNRKPGSPMLQPRDLIKEPPRIVTPEEMMRALDGWADAHNSAVN
jgi:hypothetical protein